jgi:hypothetical protein
VRRFLTMLPVAAVAGLLLGGCSGTEAPPTIKGNQDVQFQDAPVKPAGGGGGGAPAPGGKQGGASGAV